ncbi:MAG: ribosome small subunit-dependent GTPase A [Planctomycetota bacterium]|nr:MAG: ribosome small subunit-dependent GTPase A [Planctomycetota bacterium]
MARKSSSKGRPAKKRVDFRRNRQKPARQKKWEIPEEGDESAADTFSSESVRAKGELSRKRTVIEKSDGQHTDAEQTTRGTVVAVRGQFVDVDDGHRVWPCTIRRVLRTRLIRERSPVVVGDEVTIRIIADEEGLLNEGVIEKVHPRRTELIRSDGRRTHMIAANVDQVLIVASIREPMIKQHLIDRYVVAAHAGNLPASICVNKIDLDESDETLPILQRYDRLGYTTVATSALTGAGIEQLRSLLKDKVTIIAGQSGVGKSSLLNVVQPGLNLPITNVSTATQKGKHTTSTAIWIKLEMGGAVIDTPGIRALDVAMIPLNELEMHFVEFIDLVADCKYPDCVHIHEDDCAVKAAVEAGQIDQRRYDSYVNLFYELSETKKP